MSAQLAEPTPRLLVALHNATAVFLATRLRVPLSSHFSQTQPVPSAVATARGEFHRAADVRPAAVHTSNIARSKNAPAFLVEPQSIRAQLCISSQGFRRFRDDPLVARHSESHYR